MHFTLFILYTLLLQLTWLNLNAGTTSLDSNLFENTEQINNNSENQSKDNQDSVVTWSDDSAATEESEQLLDNNPVNQWFSESEEPAIFQTHKVKTNFSKHDPYYGKDLCGNGTYTCISLKKNDTWVSLFPNKYQRELVQRVNRTNKGLWNRNWILVPNDINSNYMDFSPLPKSWETNGQKTIVISISELAFGAYDKDGELLHWGPVNPGKAASKTIRGDNFKIYRKGGPECWSKKYESYIPYCMFFHEGFALHGYSMPGFAASHGCVRIYVDDALWLNKNFADYKTRVIVQD